jgi:hypothetical protein
MVHGLRDGGIEAAEIGAMTDGRRVLVHADGREELVETLDRDELYRILEALGPGSQATARGTDDE